MCVLQNISRIINYNNMIINRDIYYIYYDYKKISDKSAYLKIQNLIFVIPYIPHP